MSEPKDRQRQSVPPLLWGILGLVLICVFVIVLGVLRA
jgi:hypothetical protein